MNKKNVNKFLFFALFDGNHVYFCAPCVNKRIADIIGCSLKQNYQILIIFGTNNEPSFWLLTGIWVSLSRNYEL